LTGQSDLHPEDDKQHFNASILHFHAFVNVGRKSFCDMPPLTPGHKPRLIHRKAGKDRREQLSRRQAAFGWQAGATFEALHKVAIGKVWISGDFHDYRTVDRGRSHFSTHSRAIFTALTPCAARIGQRMPLMSQPSCGQH
jgi:hypothetical protein